MKVIHCADLHLDSKLLSDFSKDHTRDRRMEALRTFTRMVDYASKNNVRAIVIAGDLFDTRSVSITARNLVRDTIKGHPEIDFFYLRGNHDNDNFLSRMDEIPANMKLFSENWKSYSYGKVAISGIEITKDNCIELYDELELESDVFNIVTLHGNLTDSLNKVTQDKISLPELRDKYIDYLALGHVHNFLEDRLDDRGTYCYSGCLEGRSFEESGEKGFVLLEIEEETLTAKRTFVPICCRSLYTLSVDVTGVMTTEEAAGRMELALSESGYSSRSLVRLVLVGDVDMDSEINCEFLQDMFEDYFYYEQVEDQTKIRINYRDYEKDVSLKGEFIRMILNSDMDEEQKSEIIRCGIRALSGEEI